ncbi:MAG: IS110 family transposase [Rhodothermaceae bacterium]|nr:IS110 family transposase [Rhodothermaceae bacterium]
MKTFQVFYIGLIKSGGANAYVALRLIQPICIMYTHVYIGLDAHTRNCVLGAIDADANVVSVHDFPTSETGLIRHVKALPATFKYLALEESSLAGWIAGVLTPHVTELIVCDPVQNALIRRGGSKDDVRDSRKLARLLRLEELKPVYHNHDPSRVDFKMVAQQYLSITNEIVALKNQIKSKYYQGGVLKISGSLVYRKAHRHSYLKHVESEAMKKVILNFYDPLDCMVRVRENALLLMQELGKKYGEIEQFQRIPGIGVVGAHVFSAFIQTPHRFATKQQLWKYCQLGIRVRQSGGKKLSGECLDRSGASVLKAISYQCWMSSLPAKESNEVSLFYHASAKRTQDLTRARLNTQRNVLATLWTIWRKNVDDHPHLFYRPPVSARKAKQ